MASTNFVRLVTPTRRGTGGAQGPQNGTAYCRPRQMSAGGLDAQHVVQVLPRVLGHLVIITVESDRIGSDMDICCSRRLLTDHCHEGAIECFSHFRKSSVFKRLLNWFDVSDGSRTSGDS